MEAGCAAAGTCFHHACNNARWGSTAAELFCDINSRNAANGAEKSRCLAPGQDQSSTTPHCSEIFGPYSQDRVRDNNYFPQKPTDGSEPHYVYNCDPDGDNGLIPATINTIGATECTCPAGRTLQNDVCIVPGVDELIAEIEKPNPSISVVLSLLAREGVSPNITTSAGLPLLYVAATLLHAEVVSVLITAGASPTVKVPGFYHEDFNFRTMPGFIPGNLAERVYYASIPDRHISPGLALAEVLIHFGDAAGDKFNWQTNERATYSIGDLALNFLAEYELVNTPGPEEMKFLLAMAGYLQDRGAQCLSYFYGSNHLNSPLCASRRTCSARDSGKAYSCSVCAGFPLRSVNGASCVSECGISAEADTTTWPDSQCRCANGATADEFGCPSDHDPTLIAEVQEDSPNLATVRALLTQGARPNITTSAGLPLLYVAATLLHADVVSVLITAGASPTVKVPGFYHEDFNFRTMPGFIPGNLAERVYYASIPDRHISPGLALAEVLIHFGDAAGDKFNWQTNERATYSIGDLALNFLAERQLVSAPGPEEMKFLLVMAGYLQDRGAQCLSYFYGSNHLNSPLCASRRTCSARDSGKAYSCSVCAGFPLRSYDGASCVSKCGISEEADTTTWPDSQCRCANGATEDEYGDCPSDHDPTLITEVQKDSPNLATVRDLLDKGARPNITTSAGTPILVVAVTMLHAKVVSVLITAGADVSVKMDGIFDSDFNDINARRLIPMGLVEHGVHSRLPVNRRMAETFIHFGDAAGERFDWSSPDSADNQEVRVAAFHLLDTLRQIAAGTSAKALVRTMAGYLLDLGVECDDENIYLETSIPASFCARPSCRARDSGKAYSCSVCAGLPLRSANGASCVAACRGDAEADTTTWPDSQCKCPDGVTEDEFGCQSDHDSTLIAEVEKGSPDLAVVRDLLDKGARPNITISAGTPLLIVAATLGHAKIVSVLVTAGADADARDSDENAVPHIVAINDFGSAPLHYSWGTALNVLRHFADAVNQSGAAYDWTSTRINGLRAVEILEYRYSAAAAVWSGETVPEKEKAMLRMANIMLANGDSCLSSRTWSSHITCTGSGSQLLAEVQKAPGAANLSVVLERLNDDVGPDIADANGVPVLIVAATMGHAEIVSVLVTAGANVTAKDPNVSDMLNVVHHAATPLNRPAAGPRSLRASVLYYFGGGLDVRNAASGDAVFDWNAESASGYRPLDILFNATAPDKLTLAGEDENLIREMSDYIRAEGGRCGYRTNTDDHTSWVCIGASVENCGGLTPGQLYDSAAGACVACPAGHELQDEACAPTTEYLCATSKGWIYDASDDSCVIKVQIPGEAVSNKCYMSGTLSPQCATIFGSNENIFRYDNSGAGESIAPLVYNCDPSMTTGLIPATINTIRATACECPGLGQELNGDGVCAPIQCAEGRALLTLKDAPGGGYSACHDEDHIAAFNDCSVKGWNASVFGSDVLACNIPFIRHFANGTYTQDTLCVINPSEDSVADNKCRELFGNPPQFPTATGNDEEDDEDYVTHCNAEGTIPGAIPATINLTGAKECGCDSATGFVGEYPNCACPPGWDMSGGFCLSGAVMNQCVTVGWSFSAEDGGSCGVLLTLAGGESVDRCYLSGESPPQCEEVFGGTVNYFPAPTLAADGATTLRFVYDCDPNGENGLIPATANTIRATECGCFGDTAARGGGCVPLSGDFGTLSDEVLCGAFGGTVQTATGGDEVCSGMDANDTFCIMDSAAGFPCRGLFKHLRSCNLEFNRKALNPFFCGENCGEEMEAVGKDCVSL